MRILVKADDSIVPVDVDGPSIEQIGINTINNPVKIEIISSFTKNFQFMLSG